MKTFANLISIIFHPLFIPVYLLAFTLYLPVYTMQRYTEDFKILFLLYAFLIDVIVPLLLLVLMKRFRMISSLTLGKASERQLPYVMMFFIYLTTALSLMNIRGLDGIISLAFMITAAILLVVLILNRFLKISAHSASAAAGATWFFVLFKAFEISLSLQLTVALVLLGLVMSSRLYLEAHSPREVYLGAVIGILITLLGGGIYYF